MVRNSLFFLTALSVQSVGAQLVSRRLLYIRSELWYGSHNMATYLESVPLFLYNCRIETIWRVTCDVASLISSLFSQRPSKRKPWQGQPGREKTRSAVFIPHSEETYASVSRTCIACMSMTSESLLREGCAREGVNCPPICGDCSGWCRLRALILSSEAPRSPEVL